MKHSLKSLDESNGTANYSKWIGSMGKDSRLLTTPISLFSALFVCWRRNDLVNPFRVTRRELMSYSRISSVATYHKCVKELQIYGYIRYQPSFHPVKGSLVYWSDESKR